MPRKRMSGDGSIFRRVRVSPNGREYVRWQVQVSSGPRDNRQRVNRTCRTRAEAKRVLDELIADQREGRSLSRASLGSYLRRWLDETARDLAPNTRRNVHLHALLRATFWAKVRRGGCWEWTNAMRAPSVA